MKKVMVGILILIPLVVLLVVGLVTTFVSVNAYIGVESVELDKHNLTIRLDGKDDDGNYLPSYSPEYNAYKLDGDGGLFEVTVLPEKAFDRSYEWTLSNVKLLEAGDQRENGEEGVWFVELLDSKGNHADSVMAGGMIRVSNYCTFNLTVTASSYSDTCFVKTVSELKDVFVDDEITVGVGEQKVVSPLLSPVDAAAYNGRWEVQIRGEWMPADGSVGAVAVDRNGIFTGVAEGTAVVRYVAENSSGKEVVSNAMTVTVSAGLSSYGNIISSHRSRFSLSEIGVDASKVDTENSVGFTLSDAGVLTFDGGAERAVVVFAGEEDVLIINLVSENDIEIVESGVLDDYVLEVRGEPLYLTARYASVFRRGDPVDVTWSVSDEEVATVDADGVVKGITSGNITVTAQAADGTDATLEVTVQRKVAVLVGSVTEQSLMKGLARESVFPSMKYENGAVVDNTFAVGVAYPTPYEGEDEASFYEAFNFTSDHPELVQFGVGETNANVMTFNSAAIESALERGERIDITVTVTAKYPKYPNLPAYTTASFTISVTDAIGVTSDPELRDAQQEQRKATVLLNDIHMENNSNKDAVGNFTKTSNIYTYNNVYGNGFTIEAEKDQFVGKTEPFFQVYADDVLISNLTMRPNAFSDEEIEGGDLTINDASTFSAGYCIKYNVSARRRTTGEGDEVTQIKGARIEYCLMENATTLIQLSGAEVEIEGCIMRNTSGVAIHVRNVRDNAGNNVTLQHYNNLTMTNCVMSNMVGTAINFDYNNNYYVEDATTRSTFTQKGFLDIYNWQPSDSLTLIPDDTLEEALGKDFMGLKDVLFTFIRDTFSEDSFLEPYRRDYGGVTYLHLGFISMGLAAPTKITYGYLPDGRQVDGEGKIVGTEEYADLDEVSWNMNMEDKRFKHYTSSDLTNIKNIGNALGGIPFVGNLLTNPLNVWGYDDDTTDLTPGSTYTVNSRLIDRLHAGANQD